VSYAVRDDEYKLIVEDDGTELLYNLSNDAYENTNLLNNPSGGVETIKNTLLEEAARIRN
jgi:arylsulfatase A-like enzyme